MKDIPALKDALTQLWPDIGDYCEQRALPLHRLLSGQDGIPVDGSIVRYLRGSKMLTRAELAAATGVTVDAICKIENGERSPRPVLLVKILAALDAPVTAVLDQRPFQNGEGA
jgi:DNA-binding XRE family transcriptional regulator